MFWIDDFINDALREDIGPGDITTDCLIENKTSGEGVILAKQSFILAGLKLAQKVFISLDPNIKFSSKYLDGDQVDKGKIVLTVQGSLSSILKGERTALNFLQRLSGIATKTREYVNEVKDKKVKLVDTRKTTPGWRVLEKYAVRLGGGHNHRMGLYDGVLIKDNHIAVCGGISEAVNKIKSKISHLIKIEVEVSSILEVKEALDAGVDAIMLDNMEIEEIRQAVKIINGKAIVEVSGGVTLKNINALVLTKVNLISVGAITHSAIAIDLSMKIKELVN